MARNPGAGFLNMVLKRAAASVLLRVSSLTQRQVGLILVLLGVAGLIALPYANTKTSAEPEAGITCAVLTVYDGDTVGCDLNHDGLIEKPQEQIRMLGIDTPEMHYSKKNPTYGTDHPTDEPFAKEASAWTDQTLYRQTVSLDFDIERHDRYGRTLAYVYTSSGLDVGAALLKLGYARTLFLGQNHKQAARYLPIEETARRNRLGLWGLPPQS